MDSLILILIPIVLTDIINPVLLAAVIFALGSGRPVSNALAVLCGWFVLYLIAGIFIALGLETIKAFLANPRPIDFYIETVVAIFLLWLAVRSSREKNPRQKDKDFGEADRLNGFSALLIGASINLVGLPFAVPYFAAIDQILKADLDWLKSIFVLLIYNLLYLLPFIALLGIQLLYKDESKALFSKINEKITKISEFLLPIILLLIAAALLVDAGYFFLTSRPLY